MKIALGLFHFNVQYVAGDVGGYHRYCAEAVEPFLSTVSRNSKYRVSFEMAGSGLEFIAQHYPSTLDLLRELIVRRQIELISSSYVPTAWVAFPNRDLLKSVELNRRCLDSLRLNASKIFFAQEAFFGPGLETLASHFIIALCKDDYLRFASGTEHLQHIYRLGSMKVIVGANHILNEFAAIRNDRKPSPRFPFSKATDLNISSPKISFSPLSNTSSISGHLGDVEFRWYHFGSGHHFAVPAQPGMWNAFRAHPDRLKLSTQLLDSLTIKGYQLATVSEFADALKKYPQQPLPKVIEGSWNPTKSKGVYAWMGQQSSAHQDSCANLGLAWQSRSSLRKCEHALSKIKGGSKRDKLASKIEEIWKMQLFAESSDPLGWRPFPVEVQFGKAAAAQALEMSSKLLKKIQVSVKSDAVLFASRQRRQTHDIITSKTTVELVGSEGEISWEAIGERMLACTASFKATGSECGLRFLRTSNFLAYCPSAMETKPVQLVLSKIASQEFYLPLANGLISLNRRFYLIRENTLGQVAARISKSDRWITFTINKAIMGSAYKWRFIAFDGNLKQAVAAANIVNYI